MLCRVGALQSNNPIVHKRTHENTGNLSANAEPFAHKFKHFMHQVKTEQKQKKEIIMQIEMTEAAPSVLFLDFVVVMPYFVPWVLARSFALLGLAWLSTCGSFGYAAAL